MKRKDVTASFLKDRFIKYIEYNKTLGYDKPILNYKSGMIENLKVPKPLSIIGFSHFCDMGKKMFYEMLNDESKENEDIRNVLLFISNEIEDSIVSGALAQVYNANLTARLYHISDNLTTANKSDQQINIQISGKDIELK